MNIYGEKTILRAITQDDAELLLELINDPDTEKMLGGHSFPVSIEQQRAWIVNQNGRNDVLRCIVSDKDNPNIGYGTVILSSIDRENGVAEIHIKLSSKTGCGKGYGTDAILTLTDYAFKVLRLNCLYANILEYNSISQKLFEKCGYEKEGVLKSRVYKNGSYVNVISYSKVVK